MIYYGKQNISQEDIAAVEAVLKSDFLTQGPAIERFEKKVAEYCGAKYAVAVTNATSALHIACRAAGLGKGDMLWTSPNTFVASANCGLYCGADVDFVDINPATYNMSVTRLAEKLALAEQAEKEAAAVDKTAADGRQTKVRLQLPKAVVPVDFAGQSCEMEEIHRLSKQYGFTVIEDASHGIGATYKDTRIGCGKYADMTVFSFHPVKIVTTGEGGMVLTNDADLYEKLVLLRSHGITREPHLMQHESHGPWYYEQVDLGYNYRMTDIQAALGASQMDRLGEFLARRRALAARYNELLQGLPLILPYQHPDTNSSWHIYVVRLQLDKVKIDKKTLFAKMREKGIVLNLHYIPVHTQPHYQAMGFDWGDFPASEAYYREVFTLPLYYSLTDKQQEEIVNALREVLA